MDSATRSGRSVTRQSISNSSVSKIQESSNHSRHPPSPNRIGFAGRKSKNRRRFPDAWVEDGRGQNSSRVRNNQLKSERRKSREHSMNWRLVTGDDAKFDNPSEKREVYTKVSGHKRPTANGEGTAKALSRMSRDAGENHPLLVLDPVSQQDHGLYRCRMDYWKSPTTMSYTGLYVASEYRT